VGGQRKTRRAAVVTGAAGFAGALLAACGAQTGGGAADPAGAPASRAPATVIVETYASRDEFELWSRTLEGVKQKYPHLTVEAAFVSGPYERWTVAMAGDTAPHVMEFETKRMASFAEKGTLLDLTPFAAKSKVAGKADFIEGDWEKSTYKGQQYVIPAHSKPAIFFYNTELFERAGVKPPPARWADPAWTWDAFVEACRRLTTGAGPSAVYAFNQSTWWVYLQPFVWGSGGDFLTKDRTAGAIDQPAAVEMLQKVQDLGVKLKAMPLAVHNPEGSPTFTNGRVAIQHNNSGSWLPYSKVPDLKWSIGAIPTGKQGTIARNPPSGWATWSGNKARDATWLVIEELVTPQALFNTEGVPSRKAQAESGEFAAAKLIQQNGGRWQLLIDAKRSSRDEPATQYFQDLDKTIEDAKNPYWRGEVTPQQWAQQLKLKIDAVQQGKGPQA
jgi:multiple sugar transport system substrate-binding protein